MRNERGMMRQEEIEIILLKNLLREITIKYDEMIQKQNEMLQKTFNEAIRDSLTGLYNRKFFYENATKLLEIAKRDERNLVIIFIDLDNFKTINDKYGHDKGDEVLKQVASILKRGFRNSDIIARLGGDEFVVAILLGGEEDNIKKIVNRTRGEIEKNLPEISFSYGYVKYPEDGKNIQELVKIADERMYNNKRERKNVSGSER
jgi:diguanylate cyclase (GGDEF)-like protein